MWAYLKAQPGGNMRSLLVLATFAILFTNQINAFAAEAGEQAPAVVLDHYQNGQMSHHDITEAQKAGRPVFVEFFSIYCGACIANLPNIKLLAEKMDGTVRLISIDKKPELVIDFIKQYNITVEVAFDSNREAAKAYKINATPTSFLMGHDNVINDKSIGTFDDQSLNELLEKAKSL